MTAALDENNSRRPAVTVAVALLGRRLPVPVLNRVDRVRPVSCVRVTRVGGRRLTPVTDAPVLLCECFAPTSETAEVLAGRVADIFEAATGTFTVYTDIDGKIRRAWISSYTEITGPTQYPDPSTPDQDRWTVTVQLGIATHI